MTAHGSKDILNPTVPIGVCSPSSNEMSGGTDLTNTAQNDFENYPTLDVDKGIPAKNKLSEIEKNKLLDNIGKLSQNPKSSAKVTGKGVQKGRVIRVDQKKKFGFITPADVSSSNKPKLCEIDNVYFKLDSVREYLFSLKEEDIVQYTVIQGKENKNFRCQCHSNKGSPKAV